MGIISEFKEFAIKGNAVEMAVGLVIGASFTKVVSSMVDDIILPPIGFVMGGTDFSNLFIPLKATEAKTLAEAKALAIPTINIGLFANQVLTFLITAVAIFIVVKGLNKLRRKQ